jgi:co-chaperonin GroES (HSP10)|tara:strand:+ start:698 stop:961 length:264 start_codon:yes stop_codon:yes gene_type:complete
MIHPMNRYLLVDPIREEKKESGILVPEDYREEQSLYSLVRLLKTNTDSKLSEGSKLVVPAHVVEEIDIFGEKHHMVLENHVIGFFED